MKKVFEASGKTIEEAIDAALALAGDVSSFGDVDTEVLDSGSRGLFGIGSKPAKVRISYDDGMPEPVKVREFKPKEIKPIEFKVEDAKPIERKPAAPRPAKPAPKNDRPARPASKEKKGDFSNVSVKKDAFGAAPKVAEQPVAAVPRILPIVKEEADITLAEREAAAVALEFLQGIFAKMELSPEASTSYTTETVNISFAGKNLGALIGRRGETLNALQYLANLVVNRQKEGHVRIVLDVEGYREERESNLVSYARKMAEKCVKNGSKVELDPMNPHERRIVHITLESDSRVDTVSYGSEPFRKVVILPKGKKVRK